jgi:hypothetical protein
MVRSIHTMILGVAVCALAITTSQSYAGTILKLSLGEDTAADIEFTGGAGGVLSTVDDTIDGTAGEQNTAVEFSDFLDSETDIASPTASLTLDNVVASGPTIVLFGNLVVQSFTGGNLSLYDASNTLLLSGTLTTSNLSGTLGPPGTAGMFTTSFGTVTGGSLASQIDPGTLTLSIAMAGVNGGAGLSVSPPVPAIPPPVFESILNEFTADAAIIVAADPVPEPAVIALLCAALLGPLCNRRRFR